MNRAAWRPQFATLAAATLATAAGLLVAVLSRHGPSRFLDSGSYAAAIDALVHGHGLSSSLAPSFSHFSALDFVERGGRVPFVDFPAGYPVLALPLAWVIGTRSAMMVIAVLSVAVIAWMVTAHQRRRSPWYWIAASGVAFGLVLQPALLQMTRSGLSEPLFCALIVASTVVTLRTSTDADGPDRLSVAVLLAGAASLVRFVGAAAIVVPAVLLIRRRGIRRSRHWIAGSVVLPVINVLWASAVGGGHQLALREITSLDMRVTVHAVTGWFVNRFATYTSMFRDEWPPVWGVVLGCLWLVVVLAAVISLLAGRQWLPRALEVPFAMAGMLTIGLFGGMLWFDSLVTADVRLMLPAGVLTLLGLFWWAVEALDERVVVAMVALWLVVAIAPWRIHAQSAPSSSPELRELVAGARLVVSDSADAVWWETGVPSAYLPLPTRLLTGEIVDQRAELAALPCLLAEHDGIVLLTGGAFADTSLRTSLEALAVDGLLLESRHRTASGEVLRFVPTANSCVNEREPAEV